MMLIQTLPVIISLIFASGVSAIVFAWRYVALRKKALNLLYSWPSILVAGPKISGKSWLIRLMTEQDVSEHVFVDDIGLSRVKIGERTIQFVEMPFAGSSENLGKLNLKRIMYVFDTSDSSEPLDRQLEHLDWIEKKFRDVRVVPIANKVRDSKSEKLRALKDKFERIYEIPDFEDYEKKPEHLLHLKKELGDLTDLIGELSGGVPKQAVQKG
jgi:GTP1/Obg family GTP-binding protein